MSSKFCLLSSEFPRFVGEMLSVSTHTSVSFLSRGFSMSIRLGQENLNMCTVSVQCDSANFSMQSLHTNDMLMHVSYHVIQWHFSTDWVIVDFPGLALQCQRFEFCLAIATQYFIWWRRAPVRNNFCIFSIYYYLIYAYFCAYPTGTKPVATFSTF